MMRIDLGMALGIALEYIFFIYYADTLFYQKISKWLCYFIIAINYVDSVGHLKQEIHCKRKRLVRTANLSSLFYMRDCLMDLNWL